jgi:hypothetical protein
LITGTGDRPTNVLGSVGFRTLTNISGSSPPTRLFRTTVRVARPACPPVVGQYFLVP